MKVAIVGYATEGEVSAAYWRELGHEVTICDQNEGLQVPETYQKQLGPHYLEGLQAYDIIVRTPGIHPDLILEKNPGTEAKITTMVQEFFRVSPTKNIIGVTGTKGKGTTSTLIAKMLEASGKRVFLAGNIGVPPLELLTSIGTTDWVVLELSSFQLEDFKGPSPHIAVCLMVVAEHLNWHADMQEYLHAKQQLFAYQTSEDIAIYYPKSKNSKLVAGVSMGTQLPYLETPGAVVEDGFVKIDDLQICATDDIKLVGKHNWQNITAAVTAVWQIAKDPEAIRGVLTSFSGLEHRLELVRELDGVRYYDDSFATTPETAVAAIQAFEEPKVLILGGSDKGIALDPIADEVGKHTVRHVIAIGDMGPVIEKLLRDQGFTAITPGLTTMPQIVAEAHAQAQKGDVVLLSTGCASFGLFKDYKDRGNQFKQAVQALA